MTVLEEKRKTRLVRAEIIFDMKYNQDKKTSDIADEFGMTSARVCQELRYYNSTPEGKIAKKEYDDKMKAVAERRKEQAKLNKVAKKQKELDRTKKIIDSLIAGKTVKEAAKVFGITEVYVYKLINNYEKHDPEYVRKYREYAKSHQFGWNVRKANSN